MRKLIYDIAINDMSKGWISQNKLNRRIYDTWHDMIKRCYSTKYQEKRKTYEKCYVCERWLKLSNFVEDINKIDNYELWLDNPNKRIALDKDIKYKNNKEYSLEKCQFITIEENTKQAVKTRNNEYLKNNIGSLHPKHKIVAQYDLNNNLIKIWSCAEYAVNELNIKKQGISACCLGKYKQSGGFKWKYLNDISNEEIINYIIKNKQIKIG